MTLPVLLFPSCILNSLASLLVPEIAEYHALHQAKRIDGIINRVLYAALLFPCWSRASFTPMQGSYRTRFITAAIQSLFFSFLLC